MKYAVDDMLLIPLRNEFSIYLEAITDLMRAVERAANCVESGSNMQAIRLLWVAHTKYAHLCRNKPKELLIELQQITNGPPQA